MYRHLKKYMIFIVGAFVLFTFLVLAFTTDRKNDNSVNAKAEAATIKLRRLLLIVSERLRDRLVKITISMLLFLIAQAILESNSGQSGLSQAPYLQLLRD